MNFLMVILVFMPWRLRRIVYRAMGADIDDGATVGLSFFDFPTVKGMVLKDKVIVGNFNVFKGLRRLYLGEGCYVAKFNQFTATKYYLNKYKEHGGVVEIGFRAAVTMRHYFDCQGGVFIGSDSLVAGISSQFFTHQKGFKELNEAKPIRVGDRVYIGSGAILLPGTVVPSYSLVGAGSVVRGVIEKKFCLIIGNPAVIVRDVEMDSCAYFYHDNPTGENK